MDPTTENLCKLHWCDEVSWKDIYLLFKYDRSLTNLPCLSAKQFSTITGRPENVAYSVLEQFHSLSSPHLFSSLFSLNTAFLPIYDVHYPASLKQLPQPPWALFCMGNLHLLKKSNLAVIGARTGDQYGKSALKKLIPPLVQESIPIVSGLARGIDAFAHLETLEAGGQAIAVIAGGFEHFYPRENAALAKEIARGGLLVSEYAPHKKPRKWQFPARNRIISGLSKGVLVVQAAQKSGSLITASFALEQGIPVFAVPGPIWHPLSKGVHELIQDGATLVHSAKDILQEWQAAPEN